MMTNYHLESVTDSSDLFNENVGKSNENTRIHIIFDIDTFLFPKDQEEPIRPFATSIFEMLWRSQDIKASISFMSHKLTQKEISLVYRYLRSLLRLRKVPFFIGKEYFKRVKSSQSKDCPAYLDLSNFE